MIKSRTKNTPFNHNTRLKTAVEKLGLHDMYILDDLVVEKHDAYLLKVGKTGEDIFLYCNEDKRESERDAIVSKIIIAGEYRGLRIKMAGLCSLHEIDKNAVEVEFKE